MSEESVLSTQCLLEVKKNQYENCTKLTLERIDWDGT